MRYWNLTLKELKRSWLFSILFLLNLTLGLTALATIELFKSSLENTLFSRSRLLYGADLGLSARRPLSPDEQNKTEDLLKTSFQVTRGIEIFSMVTSPRGQTRLMQIKGIEPQYPFYGDIFLEDNQTLKSQISHLDSTQLFIWVYPEVLKQLGIAEGEQLKIGTQEFTIAGVVIEDTAASLSTEMAPRIYMRYEQVFKTNLVQKGTIAWHSLLYHLPNLNDEELEQRREQIFINLDEPDVRVLTHKNSSEQTASLMSRLNDFLGLSSLVALFLSSVGSAFLFRSYLRSKLISIAVLLSIGATRSKTFFYYLFQCSFLGLIASLLALCFSQGTSWALYSLTHELLPVHLELSLNFKTALLLLLWGPLFSILTSLPLLMVVFRVEPKTLFHQSYKERNVLDGRSFWSALPALLTLYGLAIYLSQSLYVGSLFIVLFFAATFVLGILGWTWLSTLGTWFKPQALSLRWAVRDLRRQRTASLTSFISLGLSALLLTLIPVVQHNLQQELAKPETLPSLFLFDIQDEQIEPLKKIIALKKIEIQQISPMIRARLLSVNGREFEKGDGSAAQLTREQETEMRFRNRGMNLSYRAELSASETLSAGKEFSGEYDPSRNEWAEISIEERFAQRLGLRLGDRLVFDIESVPVQGEIINLRKVRWSSFQPNFFIQFQPGVLEMAPKTFIATVPQISVDQKMELQNTIVEQLPNVSLIDVERVVARILETMEQMSWAFLFMSLLCFLSGLVVLYSMASHQAQTRSWEIGMLKVLGASFADIRGLFLWQFGLISLFASFIGVSLSVLMGWALTYFVFQTQEIPNLLVPGIAIVLSVLLCLIVTYVAMRRALGIQPKKLLGQMGV